MAKYPSIGETEVKSGSLESTGHELGHEFSHHDCEEDLRARRKVDLSVLPLLCLGFFVFQVDRMNLASALTSGYKSDIGINQATINLGNQMMFLGIVILEIPSNMILQRLGPKKYLSLQVLVFGLIATLQILIRNKTGFLVSRAFLGLAEAGYIPGAIYTLSTWYRRRELAKRVAVFFFGMFGGNALGPVLASGILQLDGKGGLPGWKWIFLLEGVFTIFVSMLLLLYLPGSPEYPEPLLTNGLVRISKDEARALQRRIAADNPDGISHPQHLRIKPKKVWQTICHWQRWPTFLATSLIFSTWSPLTTYTPTIIMSFGFDRTEANALASVGGLVALFVVFLFAYISDRSNQRGLTVAAAVSCYLITLIVARTTQPHTVGRWAKFGLWTAVNGFAVGYHPVHNTWLQLNSADPIERSISIAMWVMSANTGMMYGTQYFRADDLPLYSRGLSTMIGLVSAGLCLVFLQRAIYVVCNRRLANEDGKQASFIYTL
ncbi:hypothetical protein BP6252_08027 [Coleophoma cylindrospora]|uniref:Major facilitator superfamily (MFS) profile domain-containing protein n=1 Tax=Coleophoma cylindrospora TaxID=1849047 RepID=A0A3D8RC58_9HELO|nr:hypothetical protein BP6252_08027 [Coleophoma cylindrospora]